MSLLNILLNTLIMERKVFVIFNLLLALAIVDEFTEGHLEICSNDGIQSSAELVIEYPLERTFNVSSTAPLYFGLMVASSEDSYRDYLNTTVTAVQLAVDEINSDLHLLRGYSLHYTLTASQVLHAPSSLEGYY